MITTITDFMVLQNLLLSAEKEKKTLKNCGVNNNQIIKTLNYNSVRYDFCR